MNPKSPQYGMLVVAIAAAGLWSCAVTAQPAAGQARAAELARCAAYYFNATKARPMGEYEALYRAGEHALNRARRIADPAEVDRLMADASLAMSRLMGGDWHHFDRVTAKHDLSCSALTGMQAGDPGTSP